MGKIRLILAAAIVAGSIAVPAPVAQSEVIGIELSATELEIPAGWGPNQLTGVQVTNVGDRIRLGKATVGTGFEISEDSCALVPFDTGEVCYVSVLRSFGGLPGLRSTQLQFWSLEGDLLGQTTITAQTYEGLFVLAGTGGDIGGDGVVVLNSTGSGATIVSDGLGVVVTAKLPSRGAELWRLSMQPPDGQRFQAGDRLRDVARVSGESGPSLNLSVGGLGCSQGGGTVDVDRADYQGDTLVALQASFTFNCRQRHLPDVGMIVFGGSPLIPTLWAGPAAYEVGGTTGSGVGIPIILANLSAGDSPLLDQIRIPLDEFEVIEDQCSEATIGPFDACVVRVRPRSLLPGSLGGQVEFVAGGSTTVASFTGQVDRFDFVYRTTLDATSSRFVPDSQVAKSSTSTDLQTFWFDHDDRYSIVLDDIRLSVTPPAGEEFEVGTYTDLTGGEDAVALTLNAAKFTSACVESGSSFTVHEIERGPDGRPERFSASFLLRGCGLVIDGGFVLNLPLSGPAITTSSDRVFLKTVGPKRQMISLTNIGSVSTPLSIEITDDTHNAFWIVGGDCPAVLKPAQTCQQTVELALFGAGQGDPKATLAISGEGDYSSPSVFFSARRNRDWPRGPSAPSSFDAGYWLLESDGGVSAFGDARNLGSSPRFGNAIEMIPTPSGRGYWILDEFGFVWPFGDAPFLGELTLADIAGLAPGEVPVTMSATSTSQGYWIFTSLGRVFRFGDAPNIGDLTSIRLNGPIIDSATSRSGRGAYMLGVDGGVFSLGDAQFAGSVPQVLPGVVLNEPIVGISADPDGTGYWLVAADGGIFAFHAPFRGSVPSVLPAGATLVAPVNGMVPYGDGYLLVAEDGGVFSFSNLAFVGSLGGGEVSGVVAVAPIIVGGGRYQR